MTDHHKSTDWYQNAPAWGWLIVGLIYGLGGVATIATQPEAGIGGLGAGIGVLFVLRAIDQIEDGS